MFVTNIKAKLKLAEKVKKKIKIASSLTNRLRETGRKQLSRKNMSLLVYPFAVRNIQYQFNSVSVCCNENLPTLTGTHSCARLVGRTF